MLHLFASIIAAKLYKNHNRASELAMNMCDNWLYVYNKYGFIMHKLHAYRLGIISMVFGFKDYQCFIVTCKSLIFVNIVCYGDLIFDFLELKLIDTKCKLWYEFFCVKCE